jgi:hypothetical protein
MDAGHDHVSEPIARLTLDQVLAFRLRRQFLERRTTKGAPEVIRRLCGVQAQVTSAAAFAVAARRRSPKAGEVELAIRARTVVKTWAMRGTLHLLPADEAALYVATLSRLQPWRSKAWERYHGVTATEVERVTDALREVLRRPAPRSRSRSGGDVRARRLVGPGWSSPDPDEAGAALVRRYLGTFGPATPAHFAGWWARQQPGKVRPWFERLGDDVVPVEVAGASAWALAADVTSLQRARPSEAVRLLGNFDQYVLGPSAGAAAFIPEAHKAEVSRTAGWISRVVVSGGRVAGVWEADRATGKIRCDLWEPVPKERLGTEIARAESPGS